MSDFTDSNDIFDPSSELADSEIPSVDIDDLSAEADVELGAAILSAVTAKEFAAKVLEIAHSYIGVSRADNLPQVAKFLAIFNLPTKMDGKWVPFCAAGLSYAAAKAYCELNGIAYTPENSIAVFKKVLPLIKNLYFLPSPSCWQIKEDAIKRGTWHNGSSHSGVLPGWFVEYNWSGGATPEHIGAVDQAADSLHTVEFNTSGTVSGNQRDGGVVASKVRPYTSVVGFVKLYTS